MNIDYQGFRFPQSVVFSRMDKHSAKKFYDYFISNIPERISYLQSKTLIKLDYSPESLVDLWAWFLTYAEFELNHPAFIKGIEEAADKSNLPDVIKAELIQDNRYILTERTAIMATDIGIYQAELCRSICNKLYWSIRYSKTYVAGNRPILRGFVDRSVDPPFIFDQDIVGGTIIIANKVIKNYADKMDLYNIYMQKLKGNMDI